jgi:hypothetical protein
MHTPVSEKIKAEDQGTLCLVRAVPVDGMVSPYLAPQQKPQARLVGGGHIGGGG